VRLAFLLILAVLLALWASAQFVIRYIDMDMGVGVPITAYGVCNFGDRLAVMGSYFVALFDKATGKLVKMWNGSDTFYNCVSVGDRLYAVSGSGIYAFDKELNVVKSVKINWSPYAIASDGEYLYVAGLTWRYDTGEQYETVWRIEKRTLDLELVAYNKFYIDWGRWWVCRYDAYDIAINPATDELWVVGFYHCDYSGPNRTWVIPPFIARTLVLIFDKQLHAVRILDFSNFDKGYIGLPYGICFDEDGNAYVVGSVVAKFNKSGDVVAVNYLVYNVYKIACAGGRIYVFGNEDVDGYDRPLVYILSENLSIVDKFVIHKVNISSFYIGKPAVDGVRVFVAGYDFSQSVFIYSLSLNTTSVDAIVFNASKLLPKRSGTPYIMIAAYTITSLLAIAVFFDMLKHGRRPANYAAQLLERIRQLKSYLGWRRAKAATVA